METTQQQIFTEKGIPLGYFDEVDMAKRRKKVKNKVEQYNLWSLDRTVLIQPLDVDKQAIDKEKAIDFQCLFC